MARDLRISDEYVCRRQTDFAINERISRETATVNSEPSLTIQGPAAEADINYIAKAYGLTASGKLPVPAEAFDPRYYGDMSEAPRDLQSALELVRDAEKKFSMLPAEVRNRFNHNPAALWSFVQDPANREEAIKLGIMREAPPIVTNPPIEVPK